MAHRSSYDKAPVVAVDALDGITRGWRAVAERLTADNARVLVVDCYPGVLDSHLRELVTALAPDEVVDSTIALKPSAEIDRMVKPELGDDPVFGHLTSLELCDLFDPEHLAQLRERVQHAPGRVLVIGVGATLITRGDLVVDVPMPRRELELRQNRGEIGNLGADNLGTRPAEIYRRAYFVDWRLADRHRSRDVWPVADYVLDTAGPDWPVLLSASDYAAALRAVVDRPFRVVPWFEPAPWGGRWMREVCDLPPDVDNFGWCFDCVPEENSLLLDVHGCRFELPSYDVVRRHPVELLGHEVVERFGGEFPIRFDFLDTMGGGNLSLQVHPLSAYIREQFGMTFTQDESYYLLDAEDDAVVYLGVRDDVDRDAMAADLRAAQAGERAFPADRHVNIWPARPHDHFLIPAGTVHCSGRNSMVLEISATPYIFTFKLWDWDRLGLDGRPRPVHLDHGLANVQWHRDTEFVRDELINHVTPLCAGDGWRAERTGLHETEFIDTHRHWFSAPVLHETCDGINVLNLVAGDEVTVTSPEGSFAPFVVHYAETFLVPAAVGSYVITPSGPSAGHECATIKAFVRPQGEGRRLV